MRVTLLTGLLLISVTCLAADSPAPTKLQIASAIFGDVDNDKTIDVTQKIAALARDGGLSVRVLVATLGDPKTAVRKLKVSYLVDGVYLSKTADEGQTLDISTRLDIRKAVYGALGGGGTIDVTDQVAALVQRNTLSVAASNDAFGDPAGGVVKKLKVDYTFDGVAKSKTVEENQTLTIDDKGN